MSDDAKLNETPDESVETVEEVDETTEEDYDLTDVEIVDETEGVGD